MEESRLNLYFSERELIKSTIVFCNYLEESKIKF